MNKTFKMITIAGTSNETFEDAIASALATAAQSIRQMGWFEVVEQRGRVDDSGKVIEYQVTLNIGFKIEGDAS